LGFPFSPRKKDEIVWGDRHDNKLRRSQEGLLAVARHRRTKGVGADFPDVAPISLKTMRKRKGTTSGEKDT